jgi:signal transduction histidine kinase
VGNAVKFTEAGSIVINIKKTIVSDDFSRLKIEVKDTGIGFSLNIMLKSIAIY